MLMYMYIHMYVYVSEFIYRRAYVNVCELKDVSAPKKILLGDQHSFTNAITCAFVSCHYFQMHCEEVLR